MFSTTSKFQTKPSPLSKLHNNICRGGSRSAPTFYLNDTRLGIDPGTATTGYGLVRLTRDGDLVAVSYGILSTPKDASPSARLEMLFDQLNDLLKEHKPDTAAVEKLFFQTNVKTALAVGQARGVILLCIQKAGLEPFEYTPNEVKQAVAGYGGADKRQVQDMVRALLQLGKDPQAR